MKYFKVEDSKAHFCLDPETTAPVWKSIDEITKDDLMALLNRAVSPGFEMDEYNETLLQNKAHQINYKRIHHKFTELLSKTDVFNDEIENTYKTLWKNIALHWLHRQLRKMPFQRAWWRPIKVTS